ncbi:MAG: helix-turn-helix domain-containing protein [Bacilli bacterium]
MELYLGIHVLYKNIKNKVNLNHSYKLHSNKKLPIINKQSELGKKIKYYRRLNDIKQTELADLLNVSRDKIMAVENNKNIKYYDKKFVQAIIDKIDAEPLKKSNTYIGFLLDNPSQKIIEYRLKENISKTELAKRMKVSYTTIKRWEYGMNTMSKEHYKRFKELVH